MNAFAVELRRLRKLRLLTRQQVLSAAALVPLRTISDLERGISQQPHPATVRELAAGLDLTRSPGRAAAAPARSGSSKSVSSKSTANPLAGDSRGEATSTAQ